MNYSIELSNELYHHGVKGQKHGIRNALWYPISAYRAYLRKKNRKKIKSGDIDYILKHPEKYTKKDLDSAILRKEQLDKINSLKNSETNKVTFSIKSESKSNYTLPDKASKNSSTKDSNTSNVDAAKTYVDNNPGVKTSGPTVEKGKQFVNKMKTIGEGLGTANTILTNGINTYNNVARVRNAVAKDKNKWKTV